MEEPGTDDSEAGVEEGPTEEAEGEAVEEPGMDEAALGEVPGAELAVVMPEVKDPIVTVPLLIRVVVIYVVTGDADALPEESPVTAPVLLAPTVELLGDAGMGTAVETEVSVRGQTVVDCATTEVTVEAGQLETDDGHS